MEKFVSVPWKDNLLLGIFHDGGGGSDKMLVFIHGIPGDRVDAKRLPVRIARILSSNHISSLRIDLYASGISEGHFGNVMLSSQKEQIECIIKYIRCDLCYVGKIIRVAFSEAAKIVNAIARENKDVAGVCYCNGILAREEIANSLKVKRLYRRNGLFVANIGFGVWLNSNIISEIDQWSLCDARELAHVKTLFIYGDEDDLTLGSRKLAKMTDSDYFQVEIIRGADHLFTQNVFDEDIISRISKWVMGTTF